MKESYFTATVLATCLFCTIAMAQDIDNGGRGVLKSVSVGSLLPNSGHGICTAAINSNGTIAGGNLVNEDTAETKRIGVGMYEVDFLSPCNDVRAQQGFMRFIQVDTLSGGSIGHITCTTADRYGDPSSVWVNCTNEDGDNADTSFFLMVTR